MTRATFETNPLTWSRLGRGSSAGSSSRRPGRVLAAGLAAGALLLGACGGDDDDDAADSSTTTLAATVSPTTVPRVTTTVPPPTPTPTTTIAYVTEGATLIVANASGINGAAGRMSDALAIVGFSVGEPTNSSDAIGQLETTQVFYDPDAEGAKPVAESVREALGGGDIELLEVGVPAPVESGELGDATVLVMMGNDTSDKSLEELQGLVSPAEPASTDPPADDETDDTTDDTTDDETDDTTETTEA